MKNRLSISILLLGILPFLPLIVEPEVYWSFHIFILFMIWIENKKIIKSNNYIWLLGLPLIWSFLISFNDDTHSIVKAIYYLSTPLVFTFIGVQMSQIATPKMVLKYIVYSGTAGALLYIILASYTLGFTAFLDPFEIRKLILWGSITNVIAVFIVLFSEQYGVLLYKTSIHKLSIVIINLVGLYLTSSRTYYLIFIIFLIIFLYKKNKKTIFIVAGVLFIGFNILVNLKTNSVFIEKISNGASELKGGNYQTDEDVNTMYRGYESYMALKTYNSGTSMNLLFGHGYEKLVDLERYVKLGNDDYNKIPTLHNGFIYQLLREGVLGVIMILIFLLKVFRMVPKSNVLYVINLIKVGVIISLLFSNYLVNTFFSSEMLQGWLIIGIFLAFDNKERKILKIKTTTT